MTDTIEPTLEAEARRLPSSWCPTRAGGSRRADGLEAVVVETEAAAAEPEAVVAEPEADIRESEAAPVEPEAALGEPEAVVAAPPRPLTPTPHRRSIHRPSRRAAAESPSSPGPSVGSIADALHARRRDDRLHRARRELPRPARRPAGGRHPGRRDPPRGRGRVHGRGARPAHRTTGRGPRDPRRRCGQPGDRDPHRPRRLEPDVRDRRWRSTGRSGGARRSRRRTSSDRSVGWRSGRSRSTAPTRAEALIGEAVRHAVAGRPGPVLVTIPEDVLDELVPGMSGEAQPFRPTRVEPEPDDVRAVLQLLACAHRPVILAGAGVLRSRGTADLIRLVEILEVPVIASWRRGDVFPNDHRLYLGMTGLGCGVDGERAARDGRCARRAGLPARRVRVVWLRGARPGCSVGPRRSRAANRARGSRRTRPRGERRRPDVPAGGPPAGVLAASSMRRRSRLGGRPTSPIARPTRRRAPSTTSRGTVPASIRVG